MAKIVILFLSVVALLCSALAVCFLAAGGCMSNKQIIELSKQPGVLMGSGDNISMRENLEQTRHNTAIGISFIILGVFSEISSQLLRWMVEQKDSKSKNQVLEKLLEYLGKQNTH